LFVALLDDEPNPESETNVVVNPEITPVGTATQEGWEGCLSIPDIRGMVPALHRNRREALDRNGKASSCG
jgi:peptide deformylase